VVRYGEGIFVGYRYYEKKGIEPLFPFGYGLSYTTFGYRDLRLSSETLSPGGELQVMVEVTNAGGRTGSEIVQLYVSDIASRLVRPEKELKAFAKVELSPGETQTVTLKLTCESLAYYDDAKKIWMAEAGEFQVLVGSTSRDIRGRVAFTLTETHLFGEPQTPQVRLSIHSTIRELLEDEDALAVIEKHLPGFSEHPQLDLGMAFSLSQLAGFAPDLFPEGVMETIEEDFVMLYSSDAPESLSKGANEASPRFTLDTSLEQLVADEKASALLEAHFPGMLENPQLQMAMGMTLRQIAPFAPEHLTEEKLDALADDLAQI
jgi:beta-glucosidase